MELRDLFEVEEYVVGVTHSTEYVGYESVTLDYVLPKELMIALCKLYLRCRRLGTEITPFSFEFGYGFEEYLPFDGYTVDDLEESDDPFELTEEEREMVERFGDECHRDAVEYEEEIYDEALDPNGELRLILDEGAYSITVG